MTTCCRISTVGSWPLRVYYATGRRDDGFIIFGYINASNFVEKRASKDKDRITVMLASFDSDTIEITDVKGVPQHFKLLPCEELSIGITMQHYTYIDRAQSPCQSDYPTELKSLLRNPLKPEYLHNSILAPNLPYSQRTVFPSIICLYVCAYNMQTNA